MSLARRLGLAGLVGIAVALLLPRLEAQSSRGTSVARIEFLDIGQGDAILIRSPEGKTALVDAGTSSKVVEHLDERGIESLDLAIVSHHHTDHYGGMDDVVRKFKPRYFLATRSGHVTSMYKKLLADVKAAGCTFLTPDPKGVRILKLGSVDIYVLPQPPENDEEENDNSVGVVVSYGTFSVLMTGDSEDVERAWWLKTCPGTISRCTVLKLAHHGSRNGTDSHWLEVVDPEVAVASLGKDNSFGHPHKETIELLKQKAIPLYRTDQRGTITFLTNGKAWKIAGESTMASKSGNSGDQKSKAGREPAATASGDSFGRSRR